mmetsp:Transcript_17746/g.26287  ORF Transcript_17746/g.26287 Transcript_17746/m.26287 type:complete len:221 (-) Transcript_17746:64-726(-)
MILFRFVFLMLCKEIGGTIVAAKFSEGLVIAADTRDNQSNFVSDRYSEKIFKVSDGVYICSSGNPAELQHASVALRLKLEEYECEEKIIPTTKIAAHVLRRLCKANEMNKSSDFICAGNDGQLFSVTNGGALFEEDYCFFGAGSNLIAGFLDDAFEEKMEVNACEKMVRRAMELALGRDSNSGDSIISNILFKNGSKRRMIVNKCSEPMDEPFAVKWKDL